MRTSFPPKKGGGSSKGNERKEWQVRLRSREGESGLWMLRPPSRATILFSQERGDPNIAQHHNTHTHTSIHGPSLDRRKKIIAQQGKGRARARNYRFISLLLVWFFERTAPARVPFLFSSLSLSLSFLLSLVCRSGVGFRV